jgi:hypothetical protein
VADEGGLERFISRARACIIAEPAPVRKHRQGISKGGKKTSSCTKGNDEAQGMKISCIGGRTLSDVCFDLDFC